MRILDNAYMCSWIAEHDLGAYKVLCALSKKFRRDFVLGDFGMCVAFFQKNKTKNKKKPNF